MEGGVSGQNGLDALLHAVEGVETVPDRVMILRLRTEETIALVIKRSRNYATISLVQVLAYLLYFTILITC